MTSSAPAAIRQLPAAESEDRSPLMRGPLSWLVLWLVVIVFLRWPVFVTHADPSRDTAAYTQIGFILLRGGVPYIDYWDFKGPLLHLANALGLALGFGHLWGVWLLSTALTVVAVVLMVLESKRLFGTRSAALAGVIAASSLSGVLDVGGVQEQYVLPLQAISILVVTRWNDDRRPFRSGMWMGAVAMMAFFVKANLIGFALAGGLAITVATVRSGDWRKYRMWMLGTIAGAAAVAVPTVAFLAAHGAIGAFVGQFLGYSFRYIDIPVADRLSALLAGMRLAGGFSAALAFAGVAASGVALWKSDDASRTATRAFVAFWLLIELGLASLSGREYAHYFIVLVLPIGLGAAAFSELAFRERPTSRKSDPVLLLCGVIFVSSIALQAGSILRHGGLGVSPAYITTAAYIREHSGDRDPLFVWGATPQLYHMSGRRPASRFIYSFPLVTPGYTDVALVRQLIGDIETSKPPLIIDASHEVKLPSLAGANPAVSVSDPLSEWIAYVRDRYVPVDSIGDHLAFRRRAP